MTSNKVEQYDELPSPRSGLWEITTSSGSVYELDLDNHVITNVFSGGPLRPCFKNPTRSTTLIAAPVCKVGSEGFFLINEPGILKELVFSLSTSTVEYIAKLDEGITLNEDPENSTVEIKSSEPVLESASKKEDVVNVEDYVL